MSEERMAFHVSEMSEEDLKLLIEAPIPEEAKIYNNENDSFLTELRNCYLSLLKKQEPLGEDFEKVLYDNLWDLYQRTEND